MSTRHYSLISTVFISTSDEPHPYTHGTAVKDRLPSNLVRCFVIVLWTEGAGDASMTNAFLNRSGMVRISSDQHNVVS